MVVRPVDGAEGAEPPAERTLGIHDIELVDESTNPRWVAVGMVGDGVNTVEVNFDDATWSKASMANGWYATWWSGSAEALGVAAVDTPQHRHHQLRAVGGVSSRARSCSAAAISRAQASISAHGRKSPSGARTAATIARSPKPSRARSTSPANTR